LTILLGIGVATLLYGQLGNIECALLATMLAPTDAALGKAVVTNPAVPPLIREGLNVESGLNDGICVPVLLIVLTLAGEQSVGGGPAELVFHHFVQEIGIGLLVGACLALLGVRTLRLANDYG
jgi:sodium/hydrogen antiporter